MKLGELIIELGITGDIKPLKKALSGMDAASIKAKLLKKYLTDLKNAQSDEEKQTIKNAFAQKINSLRTVENIKATGGLIMKSVKLVAALGAVVTVLDRLGNSLLRSNQLFINFTNQTGMSIDRLNRMAGVAKLSGMNLPVEQVASDLTSLQQRIFKLGMTGEGSAIFAQLGMNPMGMNSDQFVDALRQRFKSMSEVQKTYVLDNLGLSREWLNVLNLTDKEYKDLVVQSKELQLTEEERKELAKYTLQQQKNNMRWELAKQRFLKAIMPITIKIMDATSKIALNLANAFSNEKTVTAVRDIAGLFGIIVLHALRVNNLLMPILKGLLKVAGLGIAGSMFGSGGLLAGLGLGMMGGSAGKTVGKAAGKGFWGRMLGFFGSKQAKKLLAKQGTKMATTAVAGAATAETGIGAIIATILEVVFAIGLVYDLIKLWIDKDNNEDQENAPVDDSALRYSYQNVNSNMVNHFYNNPQPQQVVIDNLNNAVNKYLAGTKR